MMSSLTASPAAERAPLQDRSRQSWERVLTACMELFEESGWTGLTIAEVCRRAQVSAPSIYARVQGKAGLFRAVHERWLVQFQATEDALISVHVRTGASAEGAAAAAARVVCGIFAEHRSALRALIARSIDDPSLLARGSAASRDLMERLASTLPVDQDVARMAIRAVYAECLTRTMYGSQFLQRNPEPEKDFVERVILLTTVITAGAPDVSR